MPNQPISQSILVSGILCGLGMGGFFDGIVLHQILQWHHLLSEIYPPDSMDNIRLNILADGIFHAVTWVLTAVGLWVLWRAIQNNTLFRSPRYFIGAFLVGWGLFNVIDSVLNHYILGLHHIRPGPDEALWDIAFLAWGIVMLIGGWALLAYRLAPTVREYRDPSGS